MSASETDKTAMPQASGDASANPTLSQALAKMVRAYGGEWAATVTPRTSVLVVGQEGWPLRQDGRLTRKLQKARWLQRTCSITILADGCLPSRPFASASSV